MILDNYCAVVQIRAWTDSTESDDVNGTSDHWGALRLTYDQTWTWKCASMFNAVAHGGASAEN